MDKKRIVIVDDEPIIRRSLNRVLTAAGFVCQEAASGSEALEMMKNTGFALALFDISMPGMSGVELLREVRTNWPDTWVMMLTALTDAPSAVQCMKLGAFDYMTKPFDCKDVLNIVQRAVTKREEALLLQEQRKQFDAKVRKMIVNENESKAEFLLSVAHEIKTPLTSIIASSEMLMEDVESASVTQKQNLIDCIVKSSWKLSSKITEMTDAVNPNKECLKVEYEPLEVTELLREIVREEKRYFDLKGQAIELDLPSSLPLIIADGKMFVKIIQNLLLFSSNVAAQDGKVIMRVSLGNAGRDLNIAVIDTSNAISSEESDFLFLPCYDVLHDIERPNTTGFGLELSIARKYAEAHRGTLRHIAGKIDGSILIFSMPVEPDASQYAQAMGISLQ